MRLNNVSLAGVVGLAACLVFTPPSAWPQAAAPQSRIVDRVDDNVVVTLRGNTHPLAQPQFDRGIAPPDLPMARMLLVLRRSGEQEAALQKLLDDQQDLRSPSYHQWLTPDQFGQQFGPSDRDVQTVSAWLRSHGFQVGMIGRGRTVIEFSGTAEQVQQAFHTGIHKFTVNGQDHWANANDPQVPAALAPVVLGIASLHNFRHRPMHHIVGAVPKVQAPNVAGSQFTTTDSNVCPGLGNCYFLGPYDFATIYNLLPLWNATPAIDGTGQSIAIADESNINIQDVRDFRNLFGLPANDPQVFLDGPDPGVTADGLETEALIDVEWAGAVAKSATIKLVVSEPTNSTEGADLAALYAIENNLAPVLSESFGTCELFLGTAGNAFQNAIREQAAAQGVTFMTSSGDSGAAGCDGYDGANIAEPATFGLAISGLASSPHGVAVGGTDFANFGPNPNLNALTNTASPYWSVSNNQNQASALGYVPETTWNDSCSNTLFVVLQWGNTPEASCNNSQLPAPFASPIGGGGGKSNCTASNGSATTSCSGGYAKPSWQAALGVPQDAARDIPDVSLFASSGFTASAYIICEADQPAGHGPCNLNSPTQTFLPAGGTSVSAPAFAGIVALVNQSTGALGQGNANYVLYRLASSSAQASQSCNASSTPSPGCIFYDVTSGTIAMPCARSSPNCNFSNSSDTFGILSGYNAGTGYDLATGLGSVNATNLVHSWIQPASTSTTTLSLNGGKAVSITHGQSIPFDIGVTPSAATGTVSLEGMTAGSIFVPTASFPLQNGSASGNTSALAGGSSYAVKAHYSGNGTYQPSDSKTVTVTVAAEPSKTIVTVPVFDPTTGVETTNNPTSIAYGMPAAVHVDVGNSQAATAFPPQIVCVLLTCPTGTVTLSDTFNGSTTTLSPAGGFALNSGGYVEDDALPLFSGGVHQFAASYSGDSSYLKGNSATYALTVTPAPTQMLPLSNFCPCLVGLPVSLNAAIEALTAFPGVAPSGTITFYDGNTPLSGTTTYAPMGGGTLPATLQGFLTTSVTTSGMHQISAKYSGDSNYAAVNSSTVSISVLFQDSAAVTANVATINLGQSVNVTVTVTGASKNPSMTGTFQFQGLTNSVTGTAGTDGSGNQTLTATATISPQFSTNISVNYSGDSNYESASNGVFVTVNLPDFSMSTTASTLSITAGQSGSTQLTLTPANNIANSVTLSCSGPLLGASCSFNPASPINLANGTAASTMVTIATLPPSSSPTTSSVKIRPADWKKRMFPPGLAMLLLVTLVVALQIFFLAGLTRRRVAPRLGFLALLCLVLGCGTGGGGGGGNTRTPTSITVGTSSTKVASGTNITFTATVKSSTSANGNVNLLDSGVPIATGSAFLGAATFQINYLSVGTHMISAQYDGDGFNLPSQTNGAIGQVVTGISTVFVTANSPSISHVTPITVTIQ